MKNLHTVTITGADDAVNPELLLDLSQEYPFVEWGLLRSTEREGTARYASEAWSDRCARLFQTWEDARSRFSAHLCGEKSRRLMSGHAKVVHEEAGFFGRFQMNGWGRYLLPQLRVAELYPEIEFIAQVHGQTAFAATCAFIARNGYSNVSMLFDPSGGRGIESAQYPEPFPGVKTGYAGGITAANVRSVLDRLARFETPHWIDLESGARTDDRFDLDKVRAVLELCRPYVQEKP